MKKKNLRRARHASPRLPRLILGEVQPQAYECAFCGTTVGGREALLNHLPGCDKHPLGGMVRELERTIGGLVHVLKLATSPQQILTRCTCEHCTRFAQAWQESEPSPSLVCHTEEEVAL